MSGIAPKLPLQLNPQDGIALTKTLKETIKQNLKMLVLTAPGERVMDVKFGVGLRRFFFRPMVEQTFKTIADLIRDQFINYMPFLTFSGVRFETKEQNQNLDHNQIRVKVFYTIPSIGETDSLSFIELTAS